MRAVSVSVLALTILAAQARAEIIDRILAVVQGNVITLSDVTAARRLGLVTTPSTSDPVAAVMDRLIDRTLMLIEAERYSVPEPSSAAVDARMAAVRGRFATDAEFNSVLAASGLTVDQLRRQIRDGLLLTEYLDRRFGAAIQPSDDEVREYYRQHQADFTRNGVLRPLADVSDQARAMIVAERRAALIADWLAGLRRRAEVEVLYLPVK